MSWSQRMKSAIDYIEAELGGNLDLDKAAERACSSKFHFHRMFHGMLGLTPGEYVRKRRLTLAAAELAKGDQRVLDVANKFGYDSPNAFTRAFRKLHGVNPSEVRSSGVRLSTFRRASFPILSQGEEMLNYTILEKPAFQIVGKSQRFEFASFAKEGRKFWKDFVSSEDYQSLWDLTQGRPGHTCEAPLLSVYFPDEAACGESFVDVLGVESSKPNEHSPFSTYTVPAATYAEFYCRFPEAMKTNRAIYWDWFSSTGYERDGDKPDVVGYFPMAFRSMRDMGVRWWIPVTRKS